ncbi:GNAT family N-acetyltransferase [Comamonas sp. GB3 AK4-5]|uniref:GNAT family N-acetyltransferase n=1 Tax=Comamonas sp. GB3 AK4-5 TaxID=3231487 RepID=UPI00351DF7B3
MATVFTLLNASTIPAFAGLYVAVFNAPPWNDGWEASVAVERLNAFAGHPKFHGLGMQVDGAPVALILGWGERWIRTWHFHIKEMCVAPHLQGRGLGAALLAELESRLAEMGYTHVHLTTGQAVPARHFYQRHGYRDLPLLSLGKRLQA